jgi:transcriptional regulator with XRE-family HTH domain
MPTDAAPSGSRWSDELVGLLTDDEFRHEYMSDQVRSYIAFQIRALREQRGWNQAELAQRNGTTQSTISRIEDPDYGKVSLQSCFELADTFGVALLVQFVEWDDWLSRMSNMSPSAMRKRSFNSERLKKTFQMEGQAARAFARALTEDQTGAGAARAANQNLEQENLLLLGAK